MSMSLSYLVATSARVLASFGRNELMFSFRSWIFPSRRIAPGGALWSFSTRVAYMLMLSASIWVSSQDGFSVERVAAAGAVSEWFCISNKLAAMAAFKSSSSSSLFDTA